MLGYRTLFEVDGGEDVGARVWEQWHAWIRGKKYDADAIQSGQWTKIGKGADAIWLDRWETDGSHAVRARLEETKEEGAWISQLTTLVPRAGRALVWLDINNPELGEEQKEQSLRSQRWTGTPRIARRLVEVLAAYDGRAHLGPRPRKVLGNGALGLIEILRDERRRGPVYVAGTAGGLPEPRWLDMVGDLLHETVGLGSAYVLDEEATRIFREEAGKSHCVAGGTVRTFLPGVQFGDPDDAIKHRVLSTQRIVDDPKKRLQRILGWRARRLTTSAALPPEAARLDRRFEDVLDMLLIGDRESVDTVEPRERTELPKARIEQVKAGRIESERFDTEAQDEGVRLLCQGLGVESLTAESAREVLRLVQLGGSTRERQESVHQRFSELREEREEWKRSYERINYELQQEYLEHGVTQDDLLEANNEVRHLRQKLKEAQYFDAAWSQPEPAENATPESFAELVDCVKDKKLAHVRFTGRDGRALELDEHDPVGTWAKKTWYVLLVLDDYGRAKRAGECRGDVSAYLRETPSGYRTLSTKKHAAGESEDVQSNPKLYNVRCFPVSDKENAELVFMGAHFKITQSGMISPRLHYLDCTGNDGYIYVGYIGRHLRTKQTN